MRTNFPETSPTLKFTFPGRALTLMFTCNFNGNGHQSTNIQVYNQNQNNKQNAMIKK